MKNSKRFEHYLTFGLPSSISNPGQEGKAAIEFLNLSQKRVKMMVADTWVRDLAKKTFPKFVKLAQERQVALLYGSPRLRRLFLQTKIKTIKNVVKRSFPFESLEFNIFQDFAPDILSRDFDVNSLSDDNEMWLEIIGSFKILTEESNGEYVWSFFSVWPEVKKELDLWDDLDPTRRNKLVNVIFALASHAMDVRVLAIATDYLPSLRQYYVSIDNEDNKQDETEEYIGLKSKYFTGVQDTDLKQTKEELRDLLAAVIQLANQCVDQGLDSDTLQQLSEKLHSLDDLRLRYDKERESDGQLSHEFTTSLLSFAELLTKAGNKLSDLDKKLCLKIKSVWELRFEEAGSFDTRQSIFNDLLRAIDQVPSEIEELLKLQSEFNILSEEVDNDKASASKGLLAAQKYSQALKIKTDRLCELGNHAGGKFLELVRSASPFLEEFYLDTQANISSDEILKVLQNFEEKSEVQDDNECVEKFQDKETQGCSGKLTLLCDPPESELVVPYQRIEEISAKSSESLESHVNQDETENALLNAEQEFDSGTINSIALESNNLGSATSIKVSTAPPVAPEVTSDNFIGKDSVEIAAEILENSEVAQSSVDDLLAALIIEDKLEMAYWLNLSSKKFAGFSSDIIEIAQIGSQFFPGARIAESRLSDLFKSVAEHLENIDRGDALLLAAGVVRPALMVPYTHPSYVLQKIAPLLDFIPNFHDLSTFLEEFVRNGIPLADELVRGLGDEVSWKSRHAELEKVTLRWLEDAHKRGNTKFNAATRLWTHWTEEAGDLYKLVKTSMLMTNKPKDILAEVGNWQDEGSFDDFANRTDRKINKRIKHEPIQYNARVQLRRLVLEATGLVESWVELQQSRPHTDSGYLEHSKRIFERFKKKADIVVSELTENLGEGTPRRMRAGAFILHRVLLEILNDFQGGTTPNCLDPVEMRNLMCLRIPGIEIPEKDLFDNPEGLRKILHQVVAPISIEEAITHHLDHGYLGKAKQLLKLAKNPEEIYKLLPEKQKDAKRQVESTLNKTGISLETSLLNGAVTEAERNEFSRRIERLKKDIEDKPDEPDAVLTAANSLGFEIKALAEIRNAQLLLRLTVLKNEFQMRQVAFPERLDTYLSEAVFAGNFSVVEEIILRAKKALETEEIDTDQILSDFQSTDWFENFIGRVPELMDVATNLQGTRSLIKKGQCRQLPELEAFDSTLRDSSVDILDGWIKLSGLKRNRNLMANPVALYTFLRWLGFHFGNDVRLNQKDHPQGPPNYWQHYQLEAQIESPLPRFGSMANGRHTIVLVWDRLEEEQIAQWLRKHVNKDQSVTILYFNCLDQEGRRRAALAARKSGYCPLIIDQCMLLWLCCFRGALDRTRALFDAGLPGGSHNPYMPEVAGSVPPEMFYGRRKDIEKLWRQDGPCIIYGGRQLGKSAILLQVIREYHRPLEEQYVLYAGAKHSTNVLDIFHKLLIEAGLLKASVSRDRTYSAIKELLEEKPVRRIVFLLDECDNLLEQDSNKRFEQMNQIRDLMTETGRRFKVVLTGLHNVQRFQRIPNQPLAHFGEPICIGPLEPADAVQLVQRPLEALGYRFEPANLVQRILANTNYHPSLIQLVCHDLVEHMLSSGRGNHNSPPFIIDEEVIATVYRKAGLAKKMRDRFDWTLDLDQRYRAIGYTFALLELNEKPAYNAKDLISGYSVSEILIHVQRYWPNGFTNTTIDELTGLLDEMVGLGVLMRAIGKRYRLRSPNVLRLLGDEYEILAELERFENTPFNPPAIPQVVRRVLNYSSDDGATSPLTLSQESELLQASKALNIVVGTHATGIDRVVMVVDDLFKSHSNNGVIRIEIIKLQVNTNSNSVVTKIRELYNKKSQNVSLRVILCPEQTSDSSLHNILMAIVKYLESLSTEQRFLSVVCPLGPGQIKNMRLSASFEELTAKELVKVQTLARWTEAGQGHWFDDIGRTPQKDQPAKWIGLTGGWPILLGDVHKQFIGKTNNDPSHKIDHIDFLQKSGVMTDAELTKVFEILCQLKDEVDFNDLRDLAIDEGVVENQIRIHVHLLFDYGLVIGNSERLRAEPVAAQLFHQMPRD